MRPGPHTPQGAPPSGRRSRIPGRPLRDATLGRCSGGAPRRGSIAGMIRLVACLSLALACAGSHARVTRIVIDETASEPPSASGIAYEQIAGRAFGELDPKLPGNAIIQDIELAKDADGKVRYVASFVILKPVDASKASGLMWHDVPNRGRVFAFAPQERAFGDIMLASAWQGDNAGATAVRPTASVNGMQFLQLPVARGPN